MIWWRWLGLVVGCVGLVVVVFRYIRRPRRPTGCRNHTRDED